MQHFALFVTKSPYDSRNAESAYAFCEAALALGHVIKHVFFYQSGVHNASMLLDLNSDELNMKTRWETLHRNHKVPLYVCVTAAARRGIAPAENHNKHGNLNDAFALAGMSEYFAALHDDKLKSIQF